MTKNDDFKKETLELVNQIKIYQSRYGFMRNAKNPQGLDLALLQLLPILIILRNDEENKQQRTNDSYC